MKNLKAKDIMNTDVITVSQDMTVQELAAFLTEREILGAPVVDTSGEVVGVVSCTDIALNATGTNNDPTSSVAPYYEQGFGDKFDPEHLEHLSKAAEEALPVGEIMTPTVYTVPEETAVSEIARTMVAGRIHRLLVTRGAKLVGIITTLDMLKVFFHDE